MIAVVEGPDGTGKTTLAKTLAKQGMIYQYRARHHNFTDEEMKYMLNDERVHVLDRSFLTAWVYRVVEHQPLDKEDFTFEQIIGYMKSGKLKIVYCTYPYGFQAARERGEDNIVESRIWDELKRGYDFVCDSITLFNLCPVYFYCFSTDEIDAVIEFLIGGKNGI